MSEREFNNMLLDIALLHSKGKLLFKRPRLYRGWVKRIIGDTTMWVDVRPST